MRRSVVWKRLLACLLLGALVNIAVVCWLTTRKRPIYFGAWGGGSVPQWPTGTPSHWVPATGYGEIRDERLKVQAWRYLGPRPNDLREVVPSFTDRDESTRYLIIDETILGRNGSYPPLPSTRSKSTVLAELATTEDRTVVQVRAGWPYNCFRGTCWLAHRFDAVSQTWSTTVVRNDGMAVFGKNPSDPFQAVHPMIPIWGGFLGNTATFAALISALWLSIALTRRRFRGESGRCTRCGYAVGWMTTCPECGRTGAAWTDSRMRRFLRRRARRHEGRTFTAGIAGVLVIVCFGWITSGLLWEYKTQRHIVAMWCATVMVGKSKETWHNPGAALYSTRLSNEWLPRVRTNSQSTQVIIPAWPLLTPPIFLILKPLWNRLILRAARDTEHILKERERSTVGAA